MARPNTLKAQVHRRKIVVTLGICLASGLVLPSLADGRKPDGALKGPLQIRSVAVAGKTIAWRLGRELRLKSDPYNVAFTFGPTPSSNWVPARLRFRLEGYESEWREGGALMSLTVRFADEQGNSVGQTSFDAKGQSAGWTGRVASSPLTHRRETLVVPPKAARLWMVISSGTGPPATIGVYVVNDLMVWRLPPSNGAPELLLHPSFAGEAVGSEVAPPDWIRDGIQPGMARIVELGQEPPAQAFAVLDKDPLAHAEWHNLRETAPLVTPGEHLLVEWNESFSMGVGDVRTTVYPRLPAGDFRFVVQEVSALGVPTGVQDTVVLHVPLPLAQTPLFWPAVLTGVLGASFASYRSFAWYRMQREVARLRQQRALEQERLRIAQDIHDDLGARVTQISLLSAMAQDNPTLPPKARADFDNISRMTRELVAALYETVWSVNPENDNLDALGSYLCQMVDQLCSQAQLRCRFELGNLPSQIQVSSQMRHSITMAVKEAVHNVIKHSQAGEVRLRVGFDQGVLDIAVRDDGHGFDPGAAITGSGLTNMRRRMSDINGHCVVHSHVGQGTTVNLRLELKA